MRYSHIAARSKLHDVALILVGLVLVGAAAVDIVSCVAAAFGPVAILVGSVDLWRTRRRRLWGETDGS